MPLDCSWNIDGIKNGEPLLGAEVPWERWVMDWMMDWIMCVREGKSSNCGGIHIFRSKNELSLSNLVIQTRPLRNAFKLEPLLNGNSMLIINQEGWKHTKISIRLTYQSTEKRSHTIRFPRKLSELYDLELMHYKNRQEGDVMITFYPTRQLI